MRLDVVTIARILNKLKKNHKLADYAIFGAVASSYYMVPVYTDDIDILVLADTDPEYINIWRELSKYAEKTMSFGFIISETEVQILPTSIDPLYKDALLTAKKIRVDKVTTRIVDKEHLIIMFLKANRVKDRFKASILLQTADNKYLRRLLQRFDKNGEIGKRIEKIRESANY